MDPDKDVVVDGPAVPDEETEFVDVEVTDVADEVWVADDPTVVVPDELRIELEELGLIDDCVEPFEIGVSNEVTDVVLRELTAVVLDGALSPELDDIMLVVAEAVLMIVVDEVVLVTVVFV